MAFVGPVLGFMPIIIHSFIHSKVMALSYFLRVRALGGPLVRIFGYIREPCHVIKPVNPSFLVLMAVRLSLVCARVPLLFLKYLSTV